MGFFLCLEADREILLNQLSHQIDSITANHLPHDEVIDFAFFVTIWLDRYHPPYPEHQVRAARRTGRMSLFACTWSTHLGSQAQGITDEDDTTDYRPNTNSKVN